MRLQFLELFQVQLSASLLITGACCFTGWTPFPSCCSTDSVEAMKKIKAVTEVSENHTLTSFFTVHQLFVTPVFAHLPRPNCRTSYCTF